MNDLILFITDPANLPFMVTGCLLAAIFLVEIIGLILGLSIFHSDVDFTADLNNNGIPDYLEVDGGFFNWINPGHVPAMVFIVIFSTVFTALGYSAQWAYSGFSGSLAPLGLSIPVVTALTLPFVRWGSTAFSRIMPQDITSAVTIESLTGQVGVLVMGPATSEVSGSLRVTDQHGQDHYIFVFATGDENIDVGESAVLIGPNSKNSYAFNVRKI
jgi:hypothetical protein